MSTRDLIVETAERIFADHCDKALLDAAERGEFPDALFRLVRENGLHELALADSGLTLTDAFAVFKVAGRHALPLPLPELALGNRWLGVSDGFVSIGPATADGARDVPWGRRAESVLAVDAAGARLLADVSCEARSNLAGEARDQMAGAAGDVLPDSNDALLLLTLARTMQMAGGLEKVLELSLAYAGEREQFGRPIAKFQAVQHNLAVMAAESAAAIRAADAAAEALGADPARLRLEVAAAKSRVGEAVGVVVELAHQVHGAMGYTHEHQLHHFTRRLWAWRDEYGSDGCWQAVLGRELAARGADGLWEFIASRA
jgi:alkylation response protein AidB-like acyl-CoA dehydrogenase